MDKRRLITIAVLLILYDRIEFLYYAFDNPEEKVGFILKGDPIRKDSYIYFASIMFQQVITSIIVYLFLPWRETKWFVIASVIVFIEYFFTYGQPFFKIPLPGEFYIPGSASTLRMISVCYVMYGCVKRALE